MIDDQQTWAGDGELPEGPKITGRSQMHSVGIDTGKRQHIAATVGRASAPRTSRSCGSRLIALASLRSSAGSTRVGFSAPGSTMGVGDEIEVVLETELTGPPLSSAACAMYVFYS